MRVGGCWGRVGISVRWSSVSHFEIAMSPSGVDKGELRAEQLLSIDENARIVGQQGGKPSDESCCTFAS